MLHTFTLVNQELAIQMEIYVKIYPQTISLFNYIWLSICGKVQNFQKSIHIV